jgi:Ni/Co efflux regulator RcnB
VKRITLALVACNLLWGSLAFAAEDKMQDTYRRKTREMREQQGKEDKEREAAKKRAQEKKRKGQAK